MDTNNIKKTLIRCQKEWRNMVPHLVLACAGGADETWQIFDSNELYEGTKNDTPVFPRLVSFDDGETFVPHPDAKR